MTAPHLPDEPSSTPPPDLGGGFVKPPTEEQLEAAQADLRRSLPRPQSAPLVNAALALELGGDGLERDYEFQSATYRMAPTSYTTGIQLLAIDEDLERLKALGDLIAEHLPEVRDCYRKIAELAGPLVRPNVGVNPFLEATTLEFKRLLAFLVDTGSEIHRLPDAEGVPQRYDAAHYLMAYRAVFGAPTTWRAFAAGIAYLRRVEAERAIQLYGAVAIAQWGDRESRERFLAAHNRDAGRD